MAVKKKVLTVLGNRPQFIKSKPLNEAFRRCQRIGEVIVHTGQHHDEAMSGFFYRELRLSRPRYFLKVSGSTNAAQVFAMTVKLKKVIRAEKPDLVVIYGDTNSTLAGALAASLTHTPLAHIEAGLRSFRMDMAEEFNRLISDRLADLLFAPVRQARDNLKKEGLEDKVSMTGDVLCDVMRIHAKRIAARFKDIRPAGISARDYCFFTLHRAETVDDPVLLAGVLDAVNRLTTKVIFAVHPRTRARIREYRLKHLLSNMIILEPQRYIDTLALVKNARVVLTDSGGLQREAYMLETFCVTLRDETEWEQTCASGWNELIGVRGDVSARLFRALARMALPAKHPCIFGDGHAAEKILAVVRRFLS